MTLRMVIEYAVVNTTDNFHNCSSITTDFIHELPL